MDVWLSHALAPCHPNIFCFKLLLLHLCICASASAHVCPRSVPRPAAAAAVPAVDGTPTALYRRLKLSSAPAQLGSSIPEGKTQRKAHRVAAYVLLVEDRPRRLQNFSCPGQQRHDFRGARPRGRLVRGARLHQVGHARWAIRWHPVPKSKPLDNQSALRIAGQGPDPRAGLILEEHCC